MSQSGTSNTILSGSPIPSEDIWSFPSDSSDSTEHWETHTNDKKRSRWSSNRPRLSTSRLDFDGGINWPVQYTAVNHPSTNATSKQPQQQSKSGISSPDNTEGHEPTTWTFRDTVVRLGLVHKACQRFKQHTKSSRPSTHPESIQSSGLTDNPSEQMRMRGLHYPSSSQIDTTAEFFTSGLVPLRRQYLVSPYFPLSRQPSPERPTRWYRLLNGLRKPFRKSTPTPLEYLMEIS